MFERRIKISIIINNWCNHPEFWNNRPFPRYPVTTAMLIFVPRSPCSEDQKLSTTNQLKGGGLNKSVFGLLWLLNDIVSYWARLHDRLENRANGPWPGTEIRRPAPRPSTRSHEQLMKSWFSIHASIIWCQSSLTFEGKVSDGRCCKRTAVQCSTCANKNGFLWLKPGANKSQKTLNKC